MEELFGIQVPLGEIVENAIRSYLLEPLRSVWSFIGDNILENLYQFFVNILTLPPWWLVIVAGALLVLAIVRGFGRYADWPDQLRFLSGLPQRSTAIGAGVVLLLTDVAFWAADFLGARVAWRPAYDGPYSLLDPLRPSFLLLWLPSSLVMVFVLVGLAFAASGWWLALLTGAALLLIDVIGMWAPAMLTLAMMIVAVTVAALLAIPIGILASRSRLASTIIKPVLDFMQTMPALVYVVLALVFFRLGVVPGIVATIIFSMPPAIRLTELGIRQVDAEVVEAGHAFGSTPGSILRQIQFPLAIPTIMAGINQVIMLALAMVVLAGLVGAPGLGRIVVEGISRGRLDLALAGGISIVMLAIFLDRVTGAVGSRSRAARLQQAS